LILRLDPILYKTILPPMEIISPVPS